MKVFTQSGYEVHFEVYGSGPVLMLLNGIMMSTKSWEPFIETFSKDHTLILMDFLDQGESSRLDFDYNHEIQVDAVKTVVDFLHLEDISLFGISYGGEVAIQFALEYPNDIKKLLLFNTTAWTSPWLEDIGHGWNAASNNPEAYYGATIPVIYSPQFYNEQNAWMKGRKEVLLEVFARPAFIEGMRRLTDSSVGYDVRNRLDMIDVPTYIVSSEYDCVTPRHEQEFLAEKIKKARLITIPACGHASMYEKPDLFSALVLGFTDEPGKGYKI